MLQALQKCGVPQSGGRPACGYNGGIMKTGTEALPAADADRLESLARELEASGEYVVLRRLPGVTPRPWPEGAEPATALMVDVETTGLRSGRDKVIELAVVPFRYDRRSGVITEVLPSFSAFNDPGRPIPAEIVKLTGITDEDVRGQRIDAAAVQALLADADLVLAHNAGFDRPFLEELFPAFAEKPWACTVADVNWSAESIRGSKLEYLTMSYGFHFQSHRALDDCMAAVTLLAQDLPVSGGPVLASLLANARRRTWRFRALGAPFEFKDALKNRGYRWNGTEKFWWREVGDDRRQEEHAWLAENIYRSRPVPEPIEFSALERYSSRASS